MYIRTCVQKNDYSIQRHAEDTAVTKICGGSDNNRQGSTEMQHILWEETAENSGNTATLWSSRKLWILDVQPSSHLWGNPVWIYLACMLTNSRCKHTLQVHNNKWNYVCTYCICVCIFSYILHYPPIWPTYIHVHVRKHTLWKIHNNAVHLAIHTTRSLVWSESYAAPGLIGKHLEI